MGTTGYGMAGRLFKERFVDALEPREHAQRVALVEEAAERQRVVEVLAEARVGLLLPLLRELARARAALEPQPRPDLLVEVDLFLMGCGSFIILLIFRKFVAIDAGTARAC